MKNGHPPRFEVAVANCQNRLSVDEAKMREAVVLVLRGEQVSQAEVSVAVVDDPRMQELNREYLDHDYPTDVLSFSLGEDAQHLEAEIIVSCDTAERVAKEYGWSTMDEMCLYLIHGTLHVVGYDDASDDDRRAMHSLETHYLGQLGIHRSADDHDGSRL